ncbi:hypothetical protein ABB02_01258 [Clostridiaceae bacterium JG1575]|nr:hypothetical protein ABB02_01258 [Clostridiaceae bacterium JG1575]
MNIQLLLRQNGLKITKPRETILAILREADHGMDAEWIREQAVLRGIYINLSTVYRTLDLLEELNILEKFDLGDHRYNYVLKKDHHRHTLTCEICHKSVDMDCPMTKIEELINRETGFSIKEHHLELKGVCRECAQKKERNASSQKKGA